MRVTILGKRWLLKRVVTLGDADGSCDPPDQKNKAIKILNSLRGKDELETYIHESLHAAGWHLSEEYVEQYANDLANLLWRLGYRKND